MADSKPGSPAYLALVFTFIFALVMSAAAFAASSALIAADNNGNGIANPGDIIKVVWENTDGIDVSSVTVDFSAVGNVEEDNSAIEAFDDGELQFEECGDDAADDGIWTACYEADEGFGEDAADGEELGFEVTVTDSEGNSVLEQSNTLFVDNKFPEIISAGTTSPITIIVIFSEPIDADALEADGSDFLLDGDFEITGASASGNVVTLTITPEMPGNFTSELDITEAGTVQDLADNVLDSASVDVEDGMAPVLLSARTTSTSSLELTFSEPIDGDLLDTSDFTVDDFEIDDVFVSDEDDSIVIIEIDEGMPTGATPTASIVEQQETSIRDFAGNEQTSGSVVAADGVIPEFVSAEATSPTAIAITFSEDIDGAQLTAGDFAVFRGLSEGETDAAQEPADPLDISSMSEANGVITLALASALEPGDNPQALLNPGVSITGTIKDLAGNEFTEALTADVRDKIAPALSVDQATVLAEAGQEIGFSATASDVFSGISDIQWDFGDGSDVEPGDEVTHAYSAEGVYTATVSVADGEDNAVSRAIKIVAGAAPVTFDSAPDATLTFTSIPGGTFTLSINQSSTASTSTSGFLVGGKFFEITSSLPNGAFGATLTFKYDDADDDGTVDGTSISENDLNVYYFDGSSWILVANTVRDTAANTITVTINHFTLFTLLTPTPAPAPDTGGSPNPGGSGIANTFPRVATAPAPAAAVAPPSTALATETAPETEAAPQPAIPATGAAAGAPGAGITGFITANPAATAAGGAVIIIIAAGLVYWKLRGRSRSKGARVQARAMKARNE